LWCRETKQTLPGQRVQLTTVWYIHVTEGDAAIKRTGKDSYDLSRSSQVKARYRTVL
jgi:hypothetical protein